MEMEWILNNEGLPISRISEGMRFQRLWDSIKKELLKNFVSISARVDSSD